MRKVIPFLKPKYFVDEYRILFKELVKYVNTYNKLPQRDPFVIELSNQNLREDEYIAVNGLIDDVFNSEKTEETWIVNKTEEWCQDRALHISILESISIMNGEREDVTKNVIPELLKEALGVAFDTNVGHDYIEDFEARFNSYHLAEDRIPFDIEHLNDITNGGLVNKSLTVFLAGTGVGKSLVMCHQAAAALMMGYNVLYISMEMSEEKVSERIDANILDIPIDQIRNVSKDVFTDKVHRMKRATSGKLIVKEYPTAQAHSGHFRALLNELELKKQFKPDIIFVDYLNICASSRMKMGASVNSYTYIKAIAEELRGLAVEFKVPLVSATQVTRTGFSNSDPGLEDTSESFGLPATADLMLALVSNEELEKDGQLVIKQLKNRYNDLNYKKRWVIGIDRLHMKLFDIQQPESGIVVNEPVSIQQIKNNPKLLDDKTVKEIMF